MRIEGRDRAVVPAGIDIVEQDAHAHATIGRGEHFTGEQAPGVVGVDHVVLQVERAPGLARQPDPRDEGAQPVRQQSEPRFAGCGLRNTGEELMHAGQGRSGARSHVNREAPAPVIPTASTRANCCPHMSSADTLPGTY